MEAPDAGNLVLGIADEFGVRGLLGLEHRIDALGRDNCLAFVGEYERGVLPVENDDVDLLAEIALADIPVEVGIETLDRERRIALVKRSDIVERCRSALGIETDLRLGIDEEMRMGPCRLARHDQHQRSDEWGFR